MRSLRFAFAVLGAHMLVNCSVDVRQEELARQEVAVVGGQSDPSAYGYPLPADVQNAMVAITAGAQLLCSGTVIGDRLVLSAGHCFVGNKTQWLAGSDPLPPTQATVAALGVRVGVDLQAPECQLDVEEVIMNPQLALRDMTNAKGRANPHDSAILVLKQSVLKDCGKVWPVQLRADPLTSNFVGQVLIQGGFGATAQNGVPPNYKRWWAELNLATIDDIEVEVLPQGGAYLNFGDSGSSILRPLDDGGVEIVGVVSNVQWHSRVDSDATWFKSTYSDKRLCGNLDTSGTCIGQIHASCDSEFGFSRVDCAAIGLGCKVTETGAACACLCDACEAGCACAEGACNPGTQPNGTSNDAGQGSSGCTVSNATGFDLQAWGLLAFLALSMRIRRRRVSAPKRSADGTNALQVPASQEVLR